MAASRDRLIELLKLLGDRNKRSYGSFDTIYTGDWAAIMIAQEFGESAVIPVAGWLSLWHSMDCQEPTIYRQFGFRDSESAKERRHRAIIDASATLERIPQAVHILHGALSDDSDPEGRKNAALAIGTMKSKICVDSLINALEDSDSKVVDAALYALSQIRGKSFVFGQKNPKKWRKWWSSKQS